MPIDIDSLCSLVNTVLQEQSFRYCSFSEAISTVEICGATKIQITYDRLSMCFYLHNLDEQSFRYFTHELTREFEETHNPEELKKRNEYAVLFHFMTTNREYFERRIEKRKRPDFFLPGPPSTGIEVTRLTTQYDCVLAEISRNNYGQNFSIEEIERRARKTHGMKACEYRYQSIGSIPFISTGTIDIDEVKSTYADNIIKKYDKYKDEFHLFDEFIVLCDAQNKYSVTDDYECDDILNIIKQKRSDLHGFRLDIIYTDNENMRRIRRYQL